MSSVSKTSNVTIIRRPDYARKDVDSVVEIDISNKDSKLDNNVFGDLVTNWDKKQKKKKDDEEKHTHLDKKQKKDGQTKDENGRTDFYV